MLGCSAGSETGMKPTAGEAAQAGATGGHHADGLSLEFVT